MHTIDMNPLLIQSRKRNAINGVTGMLVYAEGTFNNHKEGRFLQILEGPKREVQNIYNAIKIDSRHEQVITLKEGPIDDRNFSSWKMGYKSFDLQRNPELQYLFQLEPQSLVSNIIDHPILDFLKSFSASGKNVR